MKIIYGVVGVILLVIIIGVITARPAPKTNASTNWETVSADMKGGSMLVDVRTNEEYLAGHVENSVLIPLSDIQSGKLPEQDKSKPLYVYCRSGNRSAQAATILRKAGFTNVVDLGSMTNVLALGAKQI